MRPLATLFCPSVAVSVGGQAAVHVATLQAALRLAAPWLRVDDPWAVPDGDFRPNLLNTLVFLLSGWMQVRGEVGAGGEAWGEA